MLEFQWQHCTLISLKQSNVGIYVTLILSYRIKYDENIKFENQNLESCGMLNCPIILIEVFYVKQAKVGQY